jgi:hypothetical protein
VTITNVGENAEKQITHTVMGMESDRAIIKKFLKTLNMQLSYQEYTRDPREMKS